MPGHKSLWGKFMSAGKRLLRDAAVNVATKKRYTSNSLISKSRNLGGDRTITNVKSGRTRSSSLPHVSRMQKKRFTRKHDEGIMPEYMPSEKAKEFLLEKILSGLNRLSRDKMPLIKKGTPVVMKGLANVDEKDPRDDIISSLIARLKGTDIKGEDEMTMKHYSPSERVAATEIEQPIMDDKREHKYYYEGSII